MKIGLRAWVDDEGVLYFKNLPLFSAICSKLRGKKVIVSVSTETTNRSVQQNRYYWGVIVRRLAECIGYDDNEMHDALKNRFLKKDGLAGLTYVSTTRLSTVEFEKYQEDIRVWAATELGIRLPLPNEVTDYAA